MQVMFRQVHLQVFHHDDRLSLGYGSLYGPRELKLELLSVQDDFGELSVYTAQSLIIVVDLVAAYKF